MAEPAMDPNPEDVTPEAEPQQAGSGDPAPQEPQPLPDNWRTYFATDEKHLKQLERFTDPKKLGEAYFNAQDAIRSGQHKQPTLPENPTEEQIKEYREANGIPLTPAEYKLELEDGLTVGEQDQPIIDAVLAAAHEAHIPNDKVSPIFNAYFKQVAQVVADIGKQDETDRSETTQALMETWGSDYQANKNATENFLSRFPEDMRQKLMGARVEGGKGLLNHPEFVQSLVEIERQLNPTATIPPNSGSDPVANAQQRLAEINRFMQTNRTAYNRNEKMQEEWRTLSDFLEKQNR